MKSSILKAFMEAAFVSPFADCIPLKQLRLILKGSNSNPRLPLVNSHKPTHIPKFPNRKLSRLNILHTKIKKLRQALVHICRGRQLSSR